jgi:Tol biopolymer transport system component
MMNANGSNQINISNYPGADDHSPVWAPDGKHLLFYSGREGNWDLFLMDDDGQNVINLTNTPGTDEQEPHWRP